MPSPDIRGAVAQQSEPRTAGEGSPRRLNSIPAEVIFTPNWWFRNYGICFDPAFYLDRETRIRNDMLMRKALYERFGLGEPDPRPRPIVGSEHVAGGFVIPALLGCQIRFAADAAPWPVPRNLSDEDLAALKPPDLKTVWPMDQLVADMERLEKDFGYVCGDFDLDGVLNTALHVRGERLVTDFYDAPELAHRLFSVVTETQIAAAEYLRARTGTCSVSANRSILHVDARMFLHCNCAVQMISPASYDEFLLPYERILAGRLAPYGIHHCGNNLHLFARSYATVPLQCVDVGWGSDVARCRREFPGVFLNLRLSPVRMLQQSAATIRADARRLLEAAGDTANVGLCCINMDFGTPDENVLAMLEVARCAGVCWPEGQGSCRG